MHNYFHFFDTKITSFLKFIPAHWYNAVSLFTWLGSPVVITGLAVSVAVIAYLGNQVRLALAVLLTLVALSCNSILKLIFQRERPDTIYVEKMLVESYSFPSGHAFGSAVFYGLIAYLCFTRLPQPYAAVVSVGLIILVFLIGISRVYLGAHFPSDVIVGWLLGAVSVYVIVKLLKV